MKFCIAVALLLTGCNVDEYRAERVADCRAMLAFARTSHDSTTVAVIYSGGRTCGYWLTRARKP